MTEYLDGVKPRLYWIEWLDHCGPADPGWESLDIAASREPEYVRSVGWVMSDQDEHLVFVPTMSSEGFTQGSMCIVKKCIHKIVQLEDPTDWEMED